MVGCHPGPTVVVTAASTALAAGAGWGWPRLGWLPLAVLTGQLAVGWTNDARDADRDRRAGRVEKPTVRGWVTRRDLAAAALVAALLCVPLSVLAAGAAGAAAHLLAVGSALAYDLWLKATVASFVPYVLSFGLIPVVVAEGLVPPGRPAPWAVLTCALLGLGAHLANSARDVRTDTAVGAGGVAARVGPRTARVVGVGALLLATGVLVAQLDVTVLARAAVLGVTVAVAVAGAVLAGGRRFFETVLVLALLDVALLLASAGSLVLT